MGRKVGIWRRVKSDQMRGEGRCRSKGVEDDEARGRRKQILGESGVRCFGRVKTGGKGVKRGRQGRRRSILFGGRGRILWDG